MTVLLRPNQILKKLQHDELVSCVKSNLADPRVVEIAALSGFNCVWLDAEHTPNSIRDLEQGVRAAQAYGIDAIVRVPRGSYSDYIRPLEMGAAGIMVPHVMSPQDAADIVRVTRFHPQGLRPLDGGNADGAYGKADIQAYIEHANTQKLVIVQIEDPQAIDALDGIAQTEGIDMLFFGPGDYSHALGIPGKFDDPRIADARKLVAQAATRHGKYSGTIGSPTMIDELVDLGYRFISTGADVIGLGEYFSNLASAFNNNTSGDTPKGAYR